MRLQHDKIRLERISPRILVAHLHFFQTHKARQKMQKIYQANARQAPQQDGQTND